MSKTGTIRLNGFHAYENLFKKGSVLNNAVHLSAWHRAEREGDHWRFAVRDNGIGIDTRYWDQIFQPFQRLNVSNRPAGTDLGLAICQKIVEAHGGRIWVESQRQIGSTFFFTLPAETANAEAASGGGS